METTCSTETRPSSRPHSFRIDAVLAEVGNPPKSPRTSPSPKNRPRRQDRRKAVTRQHPLHFRGRIPVLRKMEAVPMGASPSEVETPQGMGHEFPQHVVQRNGEEKESSGRRTRQVSRIASSHPSSKCSITQGRSPHREIPPRRAICGCRQRLHSGRVAIPSGAR